MAWQLQTLKVPLPPASSTTRNGSEKARSPHITILLVVLLDILG